MLQLDIKGLAKYPFFAETGEYLRDKGLTLDELNNSDWKPAIEKAYGRITVALSGKIYNSNEEEPDMEILSFIIAVILLKSASMATLYRRFSLAEARRTENNLAKDLKWNYQESILDHVKNRSKSQQLSLKIMKEIASLEVEIEDDAFKMKIADYLRRAVHFNEREWKLVNRRVEKGFVFLTADQTVRLIRNEITRFINSRIQSVNITSVPETFKERINDLITLAKNFSDTVIISGDYPPCVKHAIEILDKGENLPHSGRFMLATYLLAKGQTTEQIAPLFKNAPDYNERVTKYQLEHIAGSSGKGTKYACPSCEKLKSENLCFAIPECNGIINPVQFGIRRKSNA